MNTRRTEAAPMALFMVLIAMVALFELALVAPYPLQAALEHWRLSWARHANGQSLAGMRHAFAYAVLFVLYVFALLRVQGQPMTRLPRSAIWLGWLVMSLLLLRGMPGDSLDIFDYIFRGRMFAEYDISPLQVPPRGLSDKPFARYVTWMDWVDAYGPVWELQSAGLARTVAWFRTGTEWVLEHNVTCADTFAVCTLLHKHITAYRAAAVVCTGFIGLLIERMAAPQERVSSVLMWLWNPLVLVASAVGGHNEALAWVWVAAALALLRNNRDSYRIMLAAMLIIFAAHVKITQLLLLLPLAVWHLQPVWRAAWRERIRAVMPLLLAMLLMLPVSWLLYSPFGGWATLERNLWERAQLSDNALPSLISQVLQRDFGWREFMAETTVGRVAQAACLIALALWARRRLCQSTSLPHLCLEALCLYLAIGAFWFQFWYIAGVVMLLALAHPSPRTTLALLLWGAGAMLAALYKDFAFNAQPPHANDRWVPWLALAIQMLPLILIAPRPGKFFYKESKLNATQTLENP